MDLSPIAIQTPVLEFWMASQPRKRRGLSTWLASTATPMFVVDARRRVMFFNSGCELLTGWAAGEVIGRTCDFTSEPDATQVEALTGILCPPPQVFNGTQQTVPAVVLTKSGERAHRMIHFFPLMNDEGGVDRVLGTISPLPDRPLPGDTVLTHDGHAELAALRADLQRRYHITSLVGKSPSFYRLVEQLAVACRHTGSIHFLGEPGTGREHAARLIHQQSESRHRPFIPIDAALMTRADLDEEIRRALRDAHDSDATDGSPCVLYIKNVEQLPDTPQRVLLEECQGSSQTRFWEQTDQMPASGNVGSPIRLMSTSTGGLETALHDDRLSEEFVHLITTQQIVIPPLRDRPEDIPFLARYFLESTNRMRDVQIADFAPDVWTAFRKYPWPGNLDELKAVIVEAREGCDHPVITMDDLPFRFRAGVTAQSVSPQVPDELVPLEDRLAEIERDHIRRALQLTNHNKNRAARLLGITRPRLYRRMEQLGLADDESADPVDR